MNKYMKMAKELANDNLKTNAGGPFGACIVKDGNTKEDAADIGFRDDFIYDFINKLSLNEQDNAILELESLNREETIEEFNKFKNKEYKTIY